MCIYLEVLAKHIALSQGAYVDLNEEELEALHEAELRARQYTQGETTNGTSD